MPNRTPTVLLAALCASLVVAAPAGAATEPVSFSVENVNRSALPCNADGRTYTLRGRIVGPPERLRSADTATLFLHEFSFGAFFWSFDAVPGYDFSADLARRGHVSVVIDRLGYDGSDRPPGLDTCLGAQADMARQVVAQLKRRFARVVLAGHSVGAAVAELAAHSFEDVGIAGLVTMGWADQGFSDRTIQQSFDQGARCTAGGEPADDGGPPAYAYFGHTPEEFQGNVFASAEPSVVAAATALRNRDPCGDVASLTPAGVVNGQRLSRIAVPVLLLFGGSDAVFTPEAPAEQSRAFSGSDDVRLETFEGAGHALALERQAPQVRATLAAWLDARWPAPAPGSAPGSGRTGRPCASRRVVAITVPRARRVAVTVNGRRVRPGRRAGGRIAVSLRGLPRSRVTVVVTVRRRGGGRTRIVRRYRTCVPRG